MSRTQPTAAEREKLARLARMVATGHRLGLSVDECLRAVHTDVLLERGRYDPRLGQYDRIEEAFAPRTGYHARRKRSLRG